MKAKINQNYFSHDSEVSLNTTLGQSEVLFAAGDDVKQLAESGALNSLHTRVEENQVLAHSNYHGIKDKLSSIIFAIETKEDEIYAEVMEKYPDMKLKMHKTD